MFDCESGKRLTKQNRIKGDIPLITAGYINNGVAEYIENKEQKTFERDTITIDMFGNCFYRSYEYKADDNILILTSKKEYTKKIKLFIVNVINKKLKGLYSYAKQYRSSSFKNTEIDLPIKLYEDNKEVIDFDIMEEIITDLENERVKDLENNKIKTISNYETITGLNNTDLTNEEKELLEKFNNDEIKMNKFKLGDLFDITPTKSYKLKNEEILSENGNIPMISNSITDNGVKGYSNLQPNNQGNTITCSDTTVGADTMFYQKDDFIGYSHIQHLIPKFKGFNRNIANFIITSCKIATSNKYNYANKFNRNAMNNTEIDLPIKLDENNKEVIDFDMIEKLMIIFQKKVINDKSLLMENKISKTKIIISKQR